MTRINLIPANLLLDQHLMAEKKEINQLAGQMQKSLRSPNFNYNRLPQAYTLGTGHVRFWYPYGTFIRDRYRDIYEECLRRKFDVQDNFNDVWKYCTVDGRNYNMNFNPNEHQIQISKNRILLRFEEKPDFYKYRGKPVDVESYKLALTVNDPKFIKEKRTN